jgi:hypothetical protein
MTKRALLGIGAIGMLVLAPPKAQAQSLAFDNYCVMGSFQVCGSVRLAAAGNNLTMQVWNLEGLLGVQHSMTAVGLYHSGTAYDWSGSINSFTARYMTSGGNTDISSYWTPQGANDIKNLGGVKVELREGTGGNAGIVGCADPGGSTHWPTCMSFDDMPYVQFDFGLSDAFSLNNVQVRWHSQQLPDGSSVKCDTGGAGDYPDCTQNVVPEPVTMLLLGTGLASMGGVGLVRRRKRNGDIENA